MPTELRIAAIGAVLLFIHIFAAIRAKTAQYGRDWNMSARDQEQPPPNPLVGRLTRAQANYAETFPIAMVALIGVVVAGRTSEWTAIGGCVWLVARLTYLPLYATGVPKWRTLVYSISMVGIAMTLWPLLAP
ncbi:MAG: MAPEG family protein [Sphingomicrobium sp.]